MYTKLLNITNSPHSLEDLVEPRQSAYSLRGKDILKLPKVNTTTYMG